MNIQHLEMNTDTVHVLIRIGELCAEETDGPRHLNPQHEEWQGGKGAVDGVVARHPHLGVDIDYLQDLHAHTREDARNDGTRGLYLRVGHVDIKSDEEQRQQEIRCEVEQMAHQGTQIFKMAHLRRKGRDIERQTDGDDEQYREEQEHRQIVGEGTDDGSRVAHLPDVVEGLLDIVHQHEHGVEHEDQSDAEEDAALGVDEIAVDEADDGICRLRLRREGVAEPYLDVFVIAETSGNGKDHRHNGDKSQECGIRERRGLSHHALSREETDGQTKLMIDIPQKALRHNKTIKKKHCSYKPGSVPPKGRLSFIYSMSHPMAPAFYPPSFTRAGNPQTTVYMNLQSPVGTA